MGDRLGLGATEVEHNAGGGVSYTLNMKGERIERMTLSVSGEHNVLNSLAACAAAHEMGIPIEKVKMPSPYSKGQNAACRRWGGLRHPCI